MFVCMRTTVDLPESLMDRVKSRLSEQKLTFRALVIAALEQALHDEPKPFLLRDVAVGPASGEKVSNATINRTMDDQRSPSFGPARK